MNDLNQFDPQIMFKWSGAEFALITSCFIYIALCCLLHSGWGEKQMPNGALQDATISPKSIRHGGWPHGWAQMVGDVHSGGTFTV